MSLVAECEHRMGKTVVILIIFSIFSNMGYIYMLILCCQEYERNGNDF